MPQIITCGYVFLSLAVAIVFFVFVLQGSLVFSSDQRQVGTLNLFDPIVLLMMCRQGVWLIFETRRALISSVAENCRADRRTPGSLSVVGDLSLGVVVHVVATPVDRTSPMFTSGMHDVGPCRASPGEIFQDLVVAKTWSGPGSKRHCLRSIFEGVVGRRGQE